MAPAINGRARRAHLGLDVRESRPLSVLFIVLAVCLILHGQSTNARAASRDGGDSSDASTTKSDAKGDSGETCTKTADCAKGLKCLSAICIDPSLGAEGDECERSTECNAHLKCEKKKCVPRVTPAKADANGAASSGSAPTPTSEAATPRNEIPPELEGFRGFRATASLGAGGSENLGFVLEFDMGYRFSDWVGVSAYVGRIAGGSVTVHSYGSSGTTETSVDVGLTNFFVGLRLGKALHADVLLGYMNANGTTDSLTATLEYSKGSAAYGLSAGYDIRLGAMWALTPRLMVLKASDSAVSDSVVVAGTLGLTLRVPRLND